MRVIVVLNRRSELTARQTTALLIAAFVRRCEVFVSEVTGLSVRDVPSGLAVVSDATPLAASCLRPDEVVAAVGRTPVRTVQLAAGDLLFLRTNPGRDPERAGLHNSVLQIAEIAQNLGIRVRNRPDRLNWYAGKASLFELAPEFRPAGLVTANMDQIREFASQFRDGCVIKPLIGSRGRDVMRLSQHGGESTEAITAVLRSGPVVCQEFIAWEQPGDVRLVVMNGKPLIVDGAVAAIHRAPAPGDFRANLHVGGTAHPIQPDTMTLAAAQQAANLLSAAGIQLAGIDLVNGKVIETNVFSTGGLFDAERFYGCDYARAVIDMMLADIGVS